SESLLCECVYVSMCVCVCERISVCECVYVSVCVCDLNSAVCVFTRACKLTPDVSTLHFSAFSTPLTRFCVRLSVYMHAYLCVCVCACVCVRACAYARVRACTCMFVCVRVFVCARAPVYVCMCSLNLNPSSFILHKCLWLCVSAAPSWRSKVMGPVM